MCCLTADTEPGIYLKLEREKERGEPREGGGGRQAGEGGIKGERLGIEKGR